MKLKKLLQTTLYHLASSQIDAIFGMIQGHFLRKEFRKNEKLDDEAQWQPAVGTKATSCLNPPDGKVGTLVKRLADGLYIFIFKRRDLGAIGISG